MSVWNGGVKIFEAPGPQPQPHADGRAATNTRTPRYESHIGFHNFRALSQPTLDATSRHTHTHTTPPPPRQPPPPR